MSERPVGDRPVDGARVPVAPLDVDGVRAVVVGTALWAVALVACLVFTDRLRDDGHLWFIAACACGVVLGLAGLAYVIRRRAAIRAAAVPGGAKVTRTEP